MPDSRLGLLPGLAGMEIISHAACMLISTEVWDTGLSSIVNLETFFDVRQFVAAASNFGLFL